MISKLLFIPRATLDIIKVLLHNNISLAERWNIAKALGRIKIASLSKKLNEPFAFPLGKWKINCLYNRHIGFLVKEIFCEEVYSLKGDQEVTTILDIGSNIGLSVGYFKMRFPNAVIKAYEPDQISFSLLQKNIGANGWESVSASEMAASDENGFLFGDIQKEKTSINSTFLQTGNENNKVAARNIAEIIDQEFNIIKIDIEGGEWKVCKKIIELQLIKKANNWFVEFHTIEQNKTLLIQIEECFTRNGYSKEIRKDVFYFYKNI